MATEHDAENQGEEHPCGDVVEGLFVVAEQATMLVEPSECPLDNPCA